MADFERLGERRSLLWTCLDVNILQLSPPEQQLAPGVQPGTNMMAVKFTLANSASEVHDIIMPLEEASKMLGNQISKMAEFGEPFAKFIADHLDKHFPRKHPGH